MASRLTEDEHSDVRTTCADGLALVAELGDTHAIQKLAMALTQELQDCSDKAREAAAESLGKVAGKGDTKTIQLLGSAASVRLWEP